MISDGTGSASWNAEYAQAVHLPGIVRKGSPSPYSPFRKFHGRGFWFRNAEMEAVEVPTVPGAHGVPVPEHGEHQDRDEQDKSPVSAHKEDDELDRSRSPRRRLNVPEPNPESPLEVLSACTSLAVGVTSMVAALKTSSEKLEVLIGNTQSLQNDMVRSMDTLAKAITAVSQP